MISIIIPTCNRLEQLKLCLQRLEPVFQGSSRIKTEVIVTDDSSTEQTEKYCQSISWVSYTRGPRRGPAANRNHGAQLASGEWLAFTDDDCLPDKFWITEYCNAIVNGVSVYEGKTTCEDGLESPLMHAPINLTGGCLWSCNFMIRKSLFNDLRGFDESYPYPYMEDADLRDRLSDLKQQVIFVPNAVVDHPPRRLASGTRMARYHESWMYHWYKRGNTKIGSPRLVLLILKSRYTSIREFAFSMDSVAAIWSTLAEVVGIIVRLPMWERKYRTKFLRD